jgi:hypothetical protein
MITKDEIRSRLAFIRTEVNPKEYKEAYRHLTDLIIELQKDVDKEYEQKRIVNQAIRDLSIEDKNRIANCVPLKSEPDAEDKKNYSYLDQ